MPAITALSVLKWGLVLTALAVIVALAVLFVVTRIENQQVSDNARRLNSASLAEPSAARSAVVYFSRSGNTAVAAQHIARRMGARLLALQAPDYEPGLPGIARALRDARNHDARITPTAADLQGVQTVYLGSPIWLYSPAPPIWAFAARHRFDGQDVVLFNTFNSKFEQRFIDDFRQLVMAQGARSFRHVFVKRGRMGQQLSTESMLGQIDETWFIEERGTEDPAR